VWLVARGFSQIEGVDFDQIFSPVVHYETIYLICAFAALEKWHMSALDVCNAYLYGKLNEEIYIEQPESYKAPNKEHKVLRLYKALYSLKKAGLTWWRMLDCSMKDLGFCRLVSDASLFIKYDKGKCRGCALFFAFPCLFLAGAYCHCATHIVVTWTPC
jgi:hypothetical protein